jgi:hypothetical protein
MSKAEKGGGNYEEASADRDRTACKAELEAFEAF